MVSARFCEIYFILQVLLYIFLKLLCETSCISVNLLIFQGEDKLDPSPVQSAHAGDEALEREEQFGVLGADLGHDVRHAQAVAARAAVGEVLGVGIATQDEVARRDVCNNNSENINNNRQVTDYARIIVHFQLII